MRGKREWPEGLRVGNKCLQSLSPKPTDPKTCTALSWERVASLGTLLFAA